MSEALWANRPPPLPGPSSNVLARCEPHELAELTAQRRQLARTLRACSGSAHPDEGSVDRLLLLFEELGSNALRHGRRPVQMTVTVSSGSWLLLVGDAAIGSPPMPAVDRDAAEGGLGLYLVASLCDDHGWTVQGPQKITWARIDYTSVSVSPDAPD